MESKPEPEEAAGQVSEKHRGAPGLKRKGEPEAAAKANAKMPKDQELGGEQQTGQDEVLGTQDGNQGRVPRRLIPSAALLGESLARAPKRACK